MLIYVAHPIDRANQHNRTKISGALASLGGGRAHINGNHLYIPSAAFKIGPGCQPDTTINAINGAALDESQAMLALWPRDAKSWGVPIEVDRMLTANKQVALVVEEDPTWAMQEDDNYMRVFKADPQEFDAFTMATLRAMDWLTGFERVERKLTHPSGFLPLPTPDSVIVAGESLTTKPGHGNIPFLFNNTDGPASDGATEGLTQARTDEEAGGVSEGQGEATETQTIGFRNLDLEAYSETYAILPTRGYKTDAGLDIYVSETTIVEPHTFVDVRSHTAVNLPAGYWGYLVGRSSTLRKKGLLVNPGVIDNGYTGELYSAIWNLTSEPVKIHAGERVAQLILMPNITPDFEPEWVKSVNESERGDKGFGSSGI